jgi:hypothetical protein
LATSELRLPFEDEDPEEVRLKPDTPYETVSTDVRGVRLQADLPDAHARRTAVDPSQNVVLEASAGTGKTRVLVERYVNLLRAGIEPDHILAITFTRKAAAEMRQRIIDRLKEASRLSELDAAQWRTLKERLGDIAISTIDAFCLSLLREFPLEADVDPGFSLADDSEVPRLVAESLDQAMRICRGLARTDEDVALVFAQLGERRLRAGLASLLDRRLVAPHALRRFLQTGPRDLTAASACEAAASRLGDIFRGVRDGLDVFLNEGPRAHPQFAMLADDLRELAKTAVLQGCATSDQNVAQGFLTAEASAKAVSPARFSTREEQAAFRALIDRLRGYFLTQDGKPRGQHFAGTGFTSTDCHTDDAWRRSLRPPWPMPFVRFGAI